MSKLWAALGSILAVILGAVGLHRSGKKQGRLEVEAETNQQGVDRANERNKIERRIVGGGDSVERLRDKWQRD